MAVGPPAFHSQELGSVPDGEATLEDGTEAVDNLGRERGETGEGRRAAALTLAPGSADQDGGFDGAVGNAFEPERDGLGFGETRGT